MQRAALVADSLSSAIILAPNFAENKREEHRKQDANLLEHSPTELLVAANVLNAQPPTEQIARDTRRSSGEQYDETSRQIAHSLRSS